MDNFYFSLVYSIAKIEVNAIKDIRGIVIKPNSYTYRAVQETVASQGRGEKPV